MTPTQAEYIARARAAKASRLARICRQMIHDCDAATFANFEDVPEPVRRRIEEVAGVAVSSDETWAIVYRILKAEHDHPDPFEGIAAEPER